MRAALLAEVLGALTLQAQKVDPHEGLWQGYDGEWGHVSRQLAALAERIPAEKYAWRPGPGVRSTNEVFMHIAGEFLSAERHGTEDTGRDHVGRYGKSFAIGKPHFKLVTLASCWWRQSSTLLRSSSGSVTRESLVVSAPSRTSRQPSGTMRQARRDAASRTHTLGTPIER